MAGERAQWVKALITRSNKLSLIPRAHRMEKGTAPPLTRPWSCLCGSCWASLLAPFYPSRSPSTECSVVSDRRPYLPIWKALSVTASNSRTSLAPSVPQNIKIYFYFCVNEYFTCMCVSAPCACLTCMEARRGHHSPEWELQVVGSHYVYAGNQRQVLCKSSKCSSPLSQLSSHTQDLFMCPGHERNFPPHPLWISLTLMVTGL